MSAAQYEQEGKQYFASKLAAGEGWVEFDKGSRPTGFLYRFVTPPKNGENKPGPTTKVTVNYRGTLINGTEFDSSYKRNKPSSFPLNGVIPCWTQVCQLMTPGSKVEIIAPHYWAYGQQGYPGLIPQCATLLFEIEMLSF